MYTYNSGSCVALVLVTTGLKYTGEKSAVEERVELSGSIAVLTMWHKTAK